MTVHPTFPLDRRCQSSALPDLPAQSIGRCSFYQHRWNMGLLLCRHTRRRSPGRVLCKTTRRVCLSITATQDLSLACMSSERQRSCRKGDDSLLLAPSTPPEPAMNPREGDLLEVVYWEALVISWHLRLSLLDTEPDPKSLTCTKRQSHAKILV